MVLNPGMFYEQPFRKERRVTQGEPVSPTIFNIAVDAVVRKFLMEVCGTQDAQHGLG